MSQVRKFGDPKHYMCYKSVECFHTPLMVPVQFYPKNICAVIKRKSDKQFVLMKIKVPVTCAW